MLLNLNGLLHGSKEKIDFSLFDRLLLYSVNYFDLRTILLAPEFNPKTLKYWVGVQQGQSYLIGRSYLIGLGWPPF